MVGFSTWSRYLPAKYHYSRAVALKSYLEGGNKIHKVFFQNLVYERMTMLVSFKGEQMPVFGTQGGTFLVRKIPDPSPKTLHIGDMVVHKDPTNLANLLVRRLVGLEGCTMLSRDDDEKFVLRKDQCWVIAGNKTPDPKEAYDSRKFGPLYVPHLVGCLRSAVDHGPINNKTIRIGDVVVHKDPKNLDNLLVRRITALENWEIEPTDVKDRSFVLVKNQCWVLADNQELNSEEARYSRVIGPLYMPYIVGRAIYFLTSAENHGLVNNSPLSLWKDSAVLRVERDIDLMIKNLEA